MSVYKHGILLPLILLCISGQVNAQTDSALPQQSPMAFELHPLFADNMVLQRDRPIRIFGTGSPGLTLTVSLGEDSGTAEVGPHGEWLVELPARAASYLPLEMKVAHQSESIVIENILIGDVWLGGGQSNMVWKIEQTPAVPVLPDNRNHPHLRMATIAIKTSPDPLDSATIADEFNGTWQPGVGDIIDQFSALGFYFGTYLQRHLDVPVGLIISGRGGTLIECWCALDTLTDIGVLDADFTFPTKVDQRKTPTALYNAMIHPLRKFPIKGVIWYQGEANANRGEPTEYSKKFQALISSWRKLFGQAEMPFLFVQLAPYPARYAPPDAWPLLREQQADSLKVPHTEMVVTTDAGEYKDIHPQDKRTPGERLAQVALSMEGIDKPARSPLFERLVIRQDGRCEIYFTNAQSGLKTQRVAMNRRPDIAPGQDPHALVAEKEILQGFEIRGADGNWIPARASIQSPGNGLPDYVEVWSPEVPDPVSVRYGWANFPLCNLYNREGQPASPFRSDR